MYICSAGIVIDAGFFYLANEFVKKFSSSFCEIHVSVIGSVFLYLVLKTSLKDLHTKNKV